MSLAQRRTTLDGIEAISLHSTRTFVSEEDGLGNSGSGSSTTTTTTSDDFTTDGSTIVNDQQQQQQQQQQQHANLLDHNENEEENVAAAEAAAATVPAEDGKEVWHTISYDPFAAQHKGGPPELHHYESFPPEFGDNVAAYEVSTAKRVGQVVFAVVACVLASGIVCGFAALKPVLIAEGVYSSLCPADWGGGPSSSSSSSSPLDQVPCPEQDMRLNLFFIAASVTLNVSTVLAGWVLDNRGRRTCYLLAALVLFLGGACMALAFHLGEQQHARLPFDGYVTGNLLLGLGGTFLFVSSYQLANAFPRRAGLVVALVTGAFDASAAVFLFYRLAYEHFSSSSSSSSSSAPAPAWWVRPKWFFLAFAVVVPALLLAAEFALMPAAGYPSRRDYQAAIAHAQDATRDAHASDDETYARAAPGALRAERRRRASLREAELAAIETVTGGAAERKADRAQARRRQAASGVDGVLLRGRQGRGASSVARQMATPWFVLLLALTVLQMTRMNYFIATVRAQYRYMLGGDEGLAERVNSFFDVALPVAGVAATPFIGVLLNEVPVWATLAVLTVLIVVLGVLNCVGTLAAGYATVVAFVLFRPLYYSAVSDYATKVFGFATFGRIYGTVICVSGVGQLAQPALDALTHGPLLRNNPLPINAAFAVAGSVISASWTLFVYTHSSSTRDDEDEDDDDDDDDNENNDNNAHQSSVEGGGEEVARRDSKKRKNKNKTSGVGMMMKKKKKKSKNKNNMADGADEEEEEEDERRRLLLSSRGDEQGRGPRYGTTS